MKQIHLSLQLDQVNQILEALGHQPYVQVYQLIGLIQQQAEAQLRADQPPAASAVPPEAPAAVTSTTRIPA